MKRPSVAWAASASAGRLAKGSVDVSFQVCKRRLALADPRGTGIRPSERQHSSTQDTMHWPHCHTGPGSCLHKRHGLLPTQSRWASLIMAWHLQMGVELLCSVGHVHGGGVREGDAGVHSPVVPRLGEHGVGVGCAPLLCLVAIRRRCLCLGLSSRLLLHAAGLEEWSESWIVMSRQLGGLGVIRSYPKPSTLNQGSEGEPDWICFQCRADSKSCRNHAAARHAAADI